MRQVLLVYVDMQKRVATLGEVFAQHSLIGIGGDVLRERVSDGSRGGDAGWEGKGWGMRPAEWEASTWETRCPNVINKHLARATEESNEFDEDQKKVRVWR